jgi:hypothetical protein
MSIKRAPRPQSHYTIISNDVLRDQNLSFRARGILASILSRPDNWRTDSESLARESKEGRTAILTALKELEQVGYLQRKKYQNEKGHWVTESLVFDKPQNPTYGNPTSVEPTSDNPTLLEELYKNELEEVDITPSGINASDVVAAYVDQHTETFGEKPPSRSIGRLAKESKVLLDEGKQPDLVIEAARHSAVNGHANIASSYTWLLAQDSRRSNQPQKESAITRSLRYLQQMEAETFDVKEIEQ